MSGITVLRNQISKDNRSNRSPSHIDFFNRNYALQLNLNPPIHHKAIHGCVNIAESGIGDGARVDRVKPGLAGVQEVLKIEKQGKVFP